MGFTRNCQRLSMSTGKSMAICVSVPPLHFKIDGGISTTAPNPSFNRTAEYGLSRYRKPAVAAAG
jgi:hypothetical protein